MTLFSWLCAGLFLPSVRAADLVNADTEDEFPTAVALGAEWEGQAMSMCSGSLITPDVVLTAAHCIEGIPVVMIQSLGLAFFGPSVSDPDFTVGFEEPVYHPEYEELQTGADLGVNDVAYLLLAESVMDVEPIWFRTDPLGDEAVGEKVTSVGFGISNSNGSGSGIKRSAILTIDEIDDVFLVSNSRTNEDDAQVCSGDSGGPMYHFDGDTWVQWAVHSWADQNCEFTSGSTRTDTVGDWLMDELEDIHGTRDQCEMWGLYDDGRCDAECDADPDCDADPIADEDEGGLKGIGCSTVGFVPRGLAVLLAMSVLFTRRRGL